MGRGLRGILLGCGVALGCSTADMGTTSVFSPPGKSDDPIGTATSGDGMDTEGDGDRGDTGGAMTTGSATAGTSTTGAVTTGAGPTDTDDFGGSSGFGTGGFGDNPACTDYCQLETSCGDFWPSIAECEGWCNEGPPGGPSCQPAWGALIGCLSGLSCPQLQTFWESGGACGPQDQAVQTNCMVDGGGTGGGTSG